MKVDLYTDAGVRDSIGTWAGVILADGVSIFEASGKLRDLTVDSTSAELRAASNALHKAIQGGVVARGDTVRVICDNARAVCFLKHGTAPGRMTDSKKAHLAATKVAHDIAKRAGVALTACGVKGHQPLTSKCPHMPGNRRADLLCRLARGDQPPEPPRPPNPKKQAKRDRKFLANTPPSMRARLGDDVVAIRAEVEGTQA